MSKTNKLFTTLILGAAGGAAAAVFLATKTGKAVKETVSSYLKEYQEDPESKHAEWVEKADSLKKQAVERYEDVRNKLESGELNADDFVETVKDKATALRDRLSQEEFLSSLTDKVTPNEGDLSIETELVSDDITIDLNDVTLVSDDVSEETTEETLS